MNDPNTTPYESIKVHFKKSLEQVTNTGHTVREFGQFILDKFGTAYVTYLRQFLSDVREGEVKIKGLSEAARKSITGHRVSVEEREALVREEAYLLAERRGFAPGQEADDWTAAEAEIDRRLAEEAGLIARGRKVLASTAADIEREFKNLKGITTTWLEEKSGSVSSRAVTKKAGKRPAKEESAQKKTVKKEPA